MGLALVGEGILRRSERVVGGGEGGFRCIALIRSLAPNSINVISIITEGSNRLEKHTLFPHSEYVCSESFILFTLARFTLINTFCRFREF